MGAEQLRVLRPAETGASSRQCQPNSGAGVAIRAIRAFLANARQADLRQDC
jgi:hypothetical protein